MIDPGSQIAHDLSKHNKLGISRGKQCGCFHCLNIFDADAVSNYTDGNQTALCPFCNIDSVVSDFDCPELDIFFLREMYNCWMEVKEFS